MAKIKIKAYCVMRDGGDGSISCKLVATEKEALETIGFSSKEEMEENYSCFYENGGYKQVEIEVESETNVVTKGFFLDTDQCEMI